MQTRKRSPWCTSASLACLTFLLTFFNPPGHRLSLAQTLYVSDGLKPGFSNHTFKDPEFLFTWGAGILVGGSNWARYGPHRAQDGLTVVTGGPIVIVLRGPVNFPDMDPTVRVLGSLISDDLGYIIGSAFDDSVGAGVPLLTIPYDGGVVGPGVDIPRPGRYEVIAYQHLATQEPGVRTLPGSGDGLGGPRRPISRWLIARAPQVINLCPATRIKAWAGPSNIDWGRERGGRDGVLGARSPEWTDPHWVSVWDEEPVGVYGTVAPTGSNGNNQPASIAHSDFPGDHFAHDVTFHLVPDPEYQWVLGTANYFANEAHPEDRENGRLEVEWEAQNDVAEVFQDIYELPLSPPKQPQLRYDQGDRGLPRFAIPTVGDRVYVVGRWILDSGHPTEGARTEIHPPRLVATMRKYHTAIDLNFKDQGNRRTRASQVDIYVSGHGGGANRFLDNLSAALNGGKRIKDVLNSGDQAIYDQPGPFSAMMLSRYYEDLSVPIDRACDFLGDQEACAIGKVIEFGVPKGLAGRAGPSGISLPNLGNLGVRGPEWRAINDMDYEFDVPLPPRPEGATDIVTEVFDQPQHTSTVKEIVTLLDTPDPRTGLPRAHVKLPFKGADNGIYARTLKFAWNVWSPPGTHYRISLSLKVRDNGEETASRGGGNWELWTDICGQWLYLTDMNPGTFRGNVKGNPNNPVDLPLFGKAWADVFLDEGYVEGALLRVFTQGYEVDDEEDFFGSLNASSYEVALALLEHAILGDAGPGDIGNGLLGGALFASFNHDLYQSTEVSSEPTKKGQDDAFPDTTKGLTSHYIMTIFVEPADPQPDEYGNP
jgi:hypothetical protein